MLEMQELQVMQEKLIDDIEDTEDDLIIIKERSVTNQDDLHIITERSMTQEASEKKLIGKLKIGNRPKPLVDHMRKLEMPIAEMTPMVFEEKSNYTSSVLSWKNKSVIGPIDQ